MGTAKSGGKMPLDGAICWVKPIFGSETAAHGGKIWWYGDEKRSSGGCFREIPRKIQRLNVSRFFLKKGWSARGGR